jgi:excisionase family DNA binding protein
VHLDLAAVAETPARLSRIEQQNAHILKLLESLRSALPPTLVDIATAAERLDVSQATIRRRVADGSLPSVRVGRALRIDLGRVRAIDVDDVASAVGGSR